MTSKACSCSKEDRIFVIQYLQKIDQEHKQEIQQLTRLITRLQDQKKIWESSLDQIKYKLKKAEQKLNSFQTKNQQFTLVQTKNINNIRKIQNPLKVGSQQIDEDITKYLYRAPIQIIQMAKVIQPSQMKVKPQNQQKMQGVLTCVIWSKDQESLQKYVGVSGNWIRLQLQKQKQVIQKILIYNPTKAQKTKQKQF